MWLVHCHLHRRRLSRSYVVDRIYVERISVRRQSEQTSYFAAFAPVVFTAPLLALAFRFAQ
jgi:hypothetical protein